MSDETFEDKMGEVLAFHEKYRILPRHVLLKALGMEKKHAFYTTATGRYKKEWHLYNAIKKFNECNRGLPLLDQLSEKQKLDVMLALTEYYKTPTTKTNTPGE